MAVLPAHVERAIFSTFDKPTAALVKDRLSVGVDVEFVTVPSIPVESVKIKSVTVPLPAGEPEPICPPTHRKY
jgi:hypothetical protein